MTIDNSTINRPAPLEAEQIAGQICDLAASIGDICDAGIGGHTEITPAQLVALRAMAGSIGALADSLGGGYRGDALEWLGAAEC